MLCASLAPLYGQEASLYQLDKTLDSASVYDKQKESLIDELKSRLKHPDDIHHNYLLLKDLYLAYQTYICDSAIHYSKILQALAQANKNAYWVNEAKIQLAKAYASAGLYHEALPLMGSIGRQDLTKEQLTSYYLTYVDTYIYLGEYVGANGNTSYVQLKNNYEDSALRVLPMQSYDYLILTGKKSIEAGKFEEAHRVLSAPILQHLKNNTRKYAIYTSIMAYLYELEGKPAKQQEFLVLAAMADIRASVKENLSFRNLAELLLNNGDVNRANRYIKKSMGDANFYNARLRNIQTSKVFPIIDKSYQLEREQQQNRLKGLLFAVSILSLFLIASIAYVIRQNQKLKRIRKAQAKTNTELQQLNLLLSESNHIKEEYLGRFLDLCSSYIDKMEEFRKSLSKKAATGKFDQIAKQLRQPDYLDDELREFYQQFDSAFLKIFPDFVIQFNQLFNEEDQIHTKTPDSLTPELRIFALMRLGIIDGTKIAKFLRFSVTTIYNYRSKYRNKALIPRDNFESEIAKIGTVAMN